MALKAIHKYFLYRIVIVIIENYSSSMRNLSEELLSKFIHFESKEDKNTYSYQFVTDVPLVKPLDGMENQENP